MGGLFGGGGGETVHNSSPIIGSLRLQTSARGKAIPLVYGKTRVAANMIWYSDFTAIPHTTTTSSGGGGKGGGGGGGGSTNTTYTYTAAVILALCEGAINSIPRIWADKDVYQGATTASQTMTAQDETYTLGGYSWDGQPHSCTVVNAAYLTGTPVVTVNGSGDEWGWGGRAQLTEGYHYSRSGGTFTFIAGYGGQQVFITYTYTVPGYFQDACAQLGLSVFGGNYSQGNWGWLQTNHAAEALAYRGLAYVAGAAYDLGDNASMPNHSFEVDTQSAYSGAIRDANPKDVAFDLLTNPHYGVGFPLQKIADWSRWSSYCVANNIFISPAYTEQAAASEILNNLMLLTNSGVFYSEGVLKILPYGDVYASANGVSYSPNLTPVYDLTDDDFLGDGEDPIKITRSTNADAWNQVQVKYYNRDNQYNEEIAEAKDQANIELFGLRTADPIDLKEVCNAASARSISQLILQRSLYIRNTYEFRLGWKFALLEPMDLVTLTDTAIGLNKTAVRVIEIEEDKYGELTIHAEEFPLNVCNSALYPTQNSGGYSANYNAAPGNVAAPAIFEGPVDLVGGTGLGVWIAATGQSADWGGCNVWVSMDGSTYKQLGKVTAGARYGTITGALAAGASSINVSLAGKGGQLIGSTTVDAQLFNTLCLIEDEFVSYTNTALLGSNQYTLSGMYRGGYHSYNVAHASGKRFVRVDDSIVKGDPLDPSMIGRTIYFKMTSFNIYGGGEQALADVTAYPYAIQGTMLKLPPNDIVSGTFSLEGFGIRLKWGKVSDPDIDFYELRLGTSWAAGTLLDRVKGQSYLWSTQVTGTYQVWVAALDIYGNYSTTPYMITCGINPPRVTSLSSVFAGESIRLNWALVLGDFSIDHYEVRSGGATWANSSPVASPMSNTFSEKAVWSGTKRYFVAAVDVAGNMGASSSVDINIVAPSQAVATVEVIDNNVLLRWQDVTQTLPVVKYEVYKGQVFATATRTAQGDTRFAALFESAAGVYVYWVVATDSAGNTSIPGSISATVSQPPDYVVRDDYTVAFEGLKSNFNSDYTAVWQGSTPPDWVALSGCMAVVTAPVAGNDSVLLVTSTSTDPIIEKNFANYITFSGCEYPIIQVRLTRIAGSGWDGVAYYQTAGHSYSASYYKGTADTNPAIGETKIVTFDMSALSAGGQDWMQNIIQKVRLDFGNTAADVFAIDWIRLLPNLGSNIYLENGVNYVLAKDETYAAHFTANGWTTPQNQVDAGFPLFFEPGANSAWYEEIIDYSTTMGATSITATMTSQTVGSVTVVPKISVKLNAGDAWTDYNGVASAFANNFRYVKVRYDFSAAGGDDLVVMTSLNVKLSLKQKTDGGSGTTAATLSTVSGNTGYWVTVPFNIAFIDTNTPSVQANGTAALIPLVVFNDVPNPVNFQVAFVDRAGNNVASVPFSWQSKGA